MKGRKDIRLKNYDYKTDGYYFVTVVSKLRENVFLKKEAEVENELKNYYYNLNSFTNSP